MAQIDLQPKNTTTYAGQAAVDRLTDLGLNLSWITRALDAGDVAARQADEFHPIMAAGTFRWMETVAALRRSLATHGWACSDDRNSPRTVNSDGTLAILPVSGNAGTGREDGKPKSRNARGETTSRVVQINGQLMLDLVAPLPDMSGEKNGRTATWFLLYYRTQNELRAELSLPARLSNTGVVEAWLERIVLPPRTYHAATLLPRDTGESDVEFPIVAL